MPSYHLLPLCYSLDPRKVLGVRAWFGSLAAVTKEQHVCVRPLVGPDMTPDMFAGFDVDSFIPVEGAAHEPGDWVETVAKLDGAKYGIEPTDWVMTIDIRDVFFQAFPFTLDLLRNPFSVHLFQESRAYFAGYEPANGQWLHRLCNGAVPAVVGDLPPVCFGVQAGPWCLLQLHFGNIYRDMRQQGAWYGHDQARLTFNARVYSGYQVHTNEDGPVMHCVLQPPLVKHSEGGGLEVATTRQIKPAIVHQYDRYASLTKWVYETYAN